MKPSKVPIDKSTIEAVLEELERAWEYVDSNDAERQKELADMILPLRKSLRLKTAGRR